MDEHEIHLPDGSELPDDDELPDTTDDGCWYLKSEAPGSMDKS